MLTVVKVSNCRWNAILKDGDANFLQRGMEKLVK